MCHNGGGNNTVAVEVSHNYPFFSPHNGSDNALYSKVEVEQQGGEGREEIPIEEKARLVRSRDAPRSNHSGQKRLIPASSEIQVVRLEMSRRE